MEDDNKDSVMAKAEDDNQVVTLPPEANETIYIKNLNEKVKLDGAF